MPATRLAGLGRPGALALLGALVLAIALLLVAAERYRPPPGSAGTGRHGDVVTYERIVTRMHEGEGYYQAAHAELLANSYGTRSVFNWRTPLYPSLLSLLPSWHWARYLLTALAIVVAGVIGKAILESADLWVAAPLGVVLVLTQVGVVTEPMAMFSEAPAGLLILLAIGFRALGRPRAAIAAALLALFIRELAAPFVLVLLAEALIARRRRELLVWAIGLAAYGGYFLWHAHNVSLMLGPMDKAYPEGWVQFGGLGFILGAAQVNGLFWVIPIAATAVALPVALIGLLAWPGRAGALAFATVLAYLAAYSVIGKPVNVYWGVMFTPLLAPGLAWAPFAFGDLARALAGRARRVESG